MLRSVLPRLARTAALSVFCVAGGLQGASAQPGTLVINASQEPPYHTADGKGFEDRLMQELFRRLGLTVTIRDVPSERGLMLLNEGVDDGTLARNPGMSRLYPNLVMISEKVLDREYVVFTKSKDFRPDGWASLAPYAVGIVTGWKILEANINEAATLTKVKDGKQLFRLLDAGRADVVVFNRWGGLYLVRTLGLDGVHLLEPPLARREVFFYLHKRHEALVGRAESALREIKADGTYERLFVEILGSRPR